MNYLLDDYLILYNNTQDKKYLTGALSILKKCQFDEETIKYLITWEMDIIRFRKLKDLIVNKSFWIKDMINNLYDYEFEIVKNINMIS